MGVGYFAGSWTDHTLYSHGLHVGGRSVYFSGHISRDVLDCMIEQLRCEEGVGVEK